MAAPSATQKRMLEHLLKRGVSDKLDELLPKAPSDHPLPVRIPKGTEHTRAALEARRKVLAEQGFELGKLYHEPQDFQPEELAGNIENFIGFAQIPVGVIGPIRVNGLFAQGDFYVPLATTEGALVASFNRGAYVISLSGGASAACMTESVSRAPVFQFSALREACIFSAWVLSQVDFLKKVTEETSRFCKLQELRTKIIGKEAYLVLEFTTGDASGQNMVTVAGDRICRYIVEGTPVKPSSWYIDGNLSGDKKATMLSFSYARGKKVVVEVTIPREVSKKVLHAEPEAIHRYWQLSFIGGTLSGSIGSQGHFANGLAAIFTACGQDIACVSEAAVGITRIDVLPDGALYFSVTLPNLIVGTVGGGTAMPTAAQCLSMLGCSGAGNVQKFAEICAAAVLAGEISMIAALTHGDFVSAHEKLGRKKTA